MKPDQTPTSWDELVSAIADQERLVDAPRRRFVATLSECDPVPLALAERRRASNLGAIVCLISGPLVLVLFSWVGGFTAPIWFVAALIFAGIGGCVIIKLDTRQLAVHHAFSNFGEEWRQYCARLRPQLRDRFPIDRSPPPLG